MLCNAFRLPFFLLFPVLAMRDGRAQDWPQWRGQNRDGIVSGETWPENLGGLKELWRVNLGKSYSGPVVVGERVFTTESINKETEHVRAFDKTTGNELWHAEWEGYQKVPFFAASNGDWMRSTPASDGESLFVAGMRDVLVSLDLASGKENWRLDFVKETKSTPPEFGFVCSPLVQGEALYVQAGGAFCRLDKKTGKVVWKTLTDGGGMMGSAFSSPILTTLGGKSQLLVQTRSSLCGVNPDDGGVLWQETIPAFRGMNILTPVVESGHIFTSAYGGKSLAFKLGQKDGKAALEQVWEHKAEAYMSTPVVIAGKGYLHLRNQRLTCFDWGTGEQHWVSKEKFGKYMSLVAQGNRILALDERGILFLIRATAEALEIVEEKKLSNGETWAHLAPSGNKLYVRELEALVCYSW